MPRRQELSSIIPNRFYEIDAVLKYQHVGEKTITGIIEQNNVQTKICLPNDGIELEEGKHYVFGKCFNSRNGWLYAKKPSETIHEKDSVEAHEIFLNLKEVFQQRDTLTNHYISTQLKVISIEPKQTVNKNGQTLILYKLKCFSDSLLINVEIWNREFNPAEMSKMILNFLGFRIRTTSHQTITLISTVYSKIQELTEAPSNPERFNCYDNVLYRNVSNIHEIRNIDQIHKACESVHKNYSISLVGINFVEEFKYDGCSKCKKKITENGCFQCGSQVTKVEYKYLKVILEDQSGMIECAIFDQQAQEIANKLNGVGKAIFKIKSTAKRNHETGQIFSSHVVTDIKEFVNPQ